MNVIDQILLEWSYRCPDGIVDMNNPEKIKILQEIFKPLITEDIEDDILDLLSKLDNDEDKKRVYNLLLKANKEEDKVDNKLEENVTKKLNQKNLTDSLADLIILYANKSKELKALSNYLDNPTITNTDLIQNNNLNSLFEPINLSDSFKNKIINLSGAVSNVTFGKGEIALIIFLKNAEKYKSGKGSSGDIKVESHILEVKRGKSILSSPSYIKRATKTDLFSSGKPKDFVEKYNIDLTKKIPWISQITSVKEADENEIKEIIKELYSGLSIDFNGVDVYNAKELNNAIGLALAKDYLKDKDLLFINDQNEYVCAEGYDVFEKAVQKGDIVFNLASDIIPRTSYKGQTEVE